MTLHNHPPLALPRALKPGDTLGVAAPASPFDKPSFEAGLAALTAMGFRLMVPDDLFARDGYLAGGDRQRARQLQRLFADPGIDGIICARGGYGTLRILEHLDAAAIARQPKVFVGFSDITALLQFLAARCGMVAFHGPTVTTLGDCDPATRDHLYAALTSTAALSVAAADPAVIRGGRAEGRLLCGNLTVLCHLTGTPFQPDYDDTVLLVEDRGEAPYRIDRMLTQMRLAGCFDRLRGLALGTFTRCGSEAEVHRIVADCLGGMGIPILAGFAVGHNARNLTLPVGLPVVLDSADGSLTFAEPALR